MDWLTLGGAIGLFVLGVVNAVASRRTHQAVAPNGDTLHDILVDLRDLAQSNANLLQRIVSFEEYQHTRNHDILNSLTRLELKLHTDRTIPDRFKDLPRD